MLGPTRPRLRGGRPQPPPAARRGRPGHGRRAAAGRRGARDGRQVALLFGGRDAAEVYPSSLLPDEVEYVVATDDGIARPPRPRDRARRRLRGLGRPGLRLRAAPMLRPWPGWRPGARPAGGGASSAGSAGRGTRSGLTRGAPEGVAPGVHGADHGLRRGGVPGLRGHGRRRAAAGLSRGPGLRGRRDRLGATAGVGEHKRERRDVGRGGQASDEGEAASRHPRQGTGIDRLAPGGRPKRTPTVRTIRSAIVEPKPARPPAGGAADRTGGGGAAAGPGGGSPIVDARQPGDRAGRPGRGRRGPRGR